PRGRRPRARRGRWGRATVQRRRPANLPHRRRPGSVRRRAALRGRAGLSARGPRCDPPRDRGARCRGTRARRAPRRRPRRRLPDALRLRRRRRLSADLARPVPDHPYFRPGAAARHRVRPPRLPARRVRAGRRCRRRHLRHDRGRRRTPRRRGRRRPAHRLTLRFNTRVLAELHSLVWATSVETLPLDRVIVRKDDYLLVRSPSNPAHHWGNLLVFDRPPGAGDARRWEQLFELEFGEDPRVRHKTFAWDRIDGEVGLAHDEFVPRGYDLDESIGLVAERRQIRAHRREYRDVLIRALDPAPGANEELWQAVVELQVAGRDEHHDEAGYRDFVRARLDGLREHFRTGRGAWYV